MVNGIAGELSSERQGLREGVLRKSVVAVVWWGRGSGFRMRKLSGKSHERGGMQ